MTLFTFSIIFDEHNALNSWFCDYDDGNQDHYDPETDIKYR